MSTRSRLSSAGNTTKASLKSSRKGSQNAGALAQDFEPDKSDIQDEIASCGDCKNACRDNDKALFCYMCERWFHAACQKVGDDMYEVISKVTRPHQ